MGRLWHSCFSYLMHNESPQDLPAQINNYDLVWFWGLTGLRLCHLGALVVSQMLVGASVLLKASSVVWWLTSIGTQLRPQLGLSARMPTYGFAVWPGLPYNMVAGFQQRAAEESQEKPYCLF